MSDGESLFAFQAHAIGLPPHEREYRFHPKRKWRLDFAYVPQKVAVEIEGGAWITGRHQRPTGFAADCEKYSVLAGMGWLVVRATTEQVKSGQALQWAANALEARK